MKRIPNNFSTVYLPSNLRRNELDIPEIEDVLNFHTFILCLIQIGTGEQYVLILLHMENSLLRLCKLPWREVQVHIAWILPPCLLQV